MQFNRFKHFMLIPVVFVIWFSIAFAISNSLAYLLDFFPMIKVSFSELLTYISIFVHSLLFIYIFTKIHKRDEQGEKLISFFFLHNGFEPKKMKKHIIPFIVPISIPFILFHFGFGTAYIPILTFFFLSLSFYLIIISTLSSHRITLQFVEIFPKVYMDPVRSEFHSGEDLGMYSPTIEVDKQNSLSLDYLINLHSTLGEKPNFLKAKFPVNTKINKESDNGYFIQSIDSEGHIVWSGTFHSHTDSFDLHRLKQFISFITTELTKKNFF